MNDNQRNVRTLIVCFTIAYLVLIPLRMIEIRRNDAGQMYTREAVVLGEQTQVVLPKAEVVELEPPYNEIDEAGSKESCLDETEARDLLKDYIKYLEQQDVTSQEFEKILEEIESVQKKICR